MTAFLAKQDDLETHSPNRRWQVNGNYFLVKLTSEQLQFFQATANELQLLRSFPLGCRKQVKPAQFKKINEQISHYLNNERVPMVVMGEATLKKTFVQSTNYPFVQIDTSNEIICDTAKMHLRANKIAGECLSAGEKEALEKFKELEKNERRTLSGIGEISPAAASGQVQQLFVEKGKKILGFLDCETGRLYSCSGRGHEKRIDIVKPIKKWVDEYQGEIFLMPRNKMPGGAALYAALRW